MANSAKQHPIKAITNFRKMTADAVVMTAVNIEGGVYNNPNFRRAWLPLRLVADAHCRTCQLQSELHPIHNGV